jgi:tetratricopeptide (TPR) repeat protein
MSERSERRRGKRKLTTWHVLIALAALLVGGFVTFRLILGAKARRRIDALRAARYPVTFEELDKSYETPPYGQNAAEYILDALTHLQEADEHERLSIPLFDNAGFPARTEPLGQETQALIVELVAKHEDALELVRRAAPIATSRYPVDFTKGHEAQLPHLSNIRRLVHLLCAKAALHAERSEADLAVETLLEALVVPKSLADEPLLISQLVRYAQHSAVIQTLERVVNRVQLNKAALTRLDEAFRVARDPDAFATALAGEACHVLMALRHPRRVGLGLARAKDDKGPSLLQMEVYRAFGLLDRALLRYADLMEDEQAAARSPINARAEAMARITKRAGQLRERDSVLWHFVTPYDRVMGYDIANGARLLVARTALAVERCRLETGELPERLDDLAPVFLEEVPQDPFDGKPLRYARRPRAYVVYSIGGDRTDDDGTERVKRRRGKGPEPTYDVTFIVER